VIKDPGSSRHGSAEGGVAGCITAGGQPQAEATVLIVESSAAHPDIAAFSNERGRYQLVGLQPGRYQLEALLGERSLRSGVDVEAGETTSLNFAFD
jgi:hypothetical protein